MIYAIENSLPRLEGLAIVFVYTDMTSRDTIHTVLAAVFHPLRFHPGSHLVMPLRR